MRFYRRVLVENGLILAGFAAAVAAIHPRGDFPLNDDWDFALATWAFARTGHFHFTNFTAVSLRAMVLWGAAWVRLFGPGFDVLRASTLTLAAATLPVVNTILRRASVTAFPRVVATLAFAFHPIFIWSSCTYMTEIPFVFVSALAFLLFFRGLTEDRLMLAVAGTLFGVISWFIRQTGVAIFLAPLAIVLIERERLTRRWKTYAALFGSALLLFVILLAARPQWLAGSVDEFSAHFHEWHEETFRIPEQIGQAGHYAISNLQNAALFLLPLTLPLILTVRRRWRPWEIAFGVLAAAVILLRVQGLVSDGHPMPYFANCCDILPGNVLTDWGLGPQTLPDVWSGIHRYPVRLTPAARLLLTYGTAVIAIAIAIALTRAVVVERRPILQLAIGVSIAATAALIGSGYYYDRYELDSAWPIAIALTVLLPWNRRICRILAVTALLSIAVFDVAAVHDYFEWNRARWSAIETLRRGGVPVTQLNGGSEASNLLEKWSMTRREWRRSLADPPRRYVIAFTPMAGYRVVARTRWRVWLGATESELLTLEKI